ncbi:MAG: class I SAM-dependent methyltransferase [Planctomycetia bacterium]|nr:class I SAM-dependent methyltransferase [Planctomycetia bacterium]
MKLWPLVRRWWAVLVVLIALLIWWQAFNYLVDFRDPDVPYVPTPNDVVKAMFELGEVTDKDMVYDLGSGDGRIIVAAGRDLGARAVGFEIQPELVAQSEIAIREAGIADRVQVRRGDLFKQDLSGATVITIFLKPIVNVQLRPQLDRLRPGIRIVSHMFSMPGAKPVRRISVKSVETGMDHNLYLWVTPIEWDY